MFKNQSKDPLTLTELPEIIPDLSEDKEKYFITYSQLDDVNGGLYLQIYNRIIREHPITWINKQNSRIKPKSVKLMLINWKLLRGDEKNLKINSSYPHQEYNGKCVIL